MTYVDGFVIPVPSANKQAYLEMAENAATVFLRCGAIHIAENWGDDVAHGQNTDFFRAVAAEEGETVVFSWITWPSKEARDSGNAAAMADPFFSDMAGNSVFDGKRMIYSGFQTIVDVKG